MMSRIGFLQVMLFYPTLISMASPTYKDPINFCPEGFFGYECRFRCHCHNVGIKKGCKMSGQCFDGETCARPYFGYLCQYLNIAQEVVREETFAIDWDTRTCNNLTSGSDMIFTFKKEVPFHFISIEFKSYNDSEARSFSKFELLFPMSPNGNFCVSTSYWNISRTRADIYCFSHQFVPMKKLVLSGPAISYICEVYISGGRDLTHLTEMTIQNAVVVEQPDDSLHGTGSDSSCTLASTEKPYLRWLLKFNIELFVLRVRLYNSKGKYRLADFTLGMDNWGNISFTRSLDVYDVAVRSIEKKVGCLHVEVNKKRGKKNETLYNQMCGLHIYGDCPPETAGLECKINCRSCFGQSPCNIYDMCYKGRGGQFRIYSSECVNCATGTDCVGGYCTGGCQPGFKGPRCTEVCGKCGGFGDCDQTTGVCISGCLDGHAGPLCNQPCGMCSDKICNSSNLICTSGLCRPGYRGQQCFQRCLHCGGNGACNINDGTCLQDCKLGFRGDVCLLRCTNCAGLGACDKKTGYCLEGCNLGFKGKACSEHCTNCGGNGECNSTTGRCKHGCQYGFKGNACILPCNNCINQKCNETTGFCYLGCVKGYYKKDCERACSNCDGDGSCDNVTGKCKQGCKAGFYGEMCNEVFL